jgi:hypothetical protein
MSFCQPFGFFEQCSKCSPPAQLKAQGRDRKRSTTRAHRTSYTRRTHAPDTWHIVSVTLTSATCPSSDGKLRSWSLQLFVRRRQTLSSVARTLVPVLYSTTRGNLLSPVCRHHEHRQRQKEHCRPTHTGANRREGQRHLQNHSRPHTPAGRSRSSRSCRTPPARYLSTYTITDNTCISMDTASDIVLGKFFDASLLAPHPTTPQAILAAAASAAASSRTFTIDGSGTVTAAHSSATGKKRSDSISQWLAVFSRVRLIAVRRAQAFPIRAKPTDSPFPTPAEAALQCNAYITAITETAADLGDDVALMYDLNHHSGSRRTGGSSIPSDSRS